MARWTVVKYHFHTKKSDNVHTLEFIVSNNGHTVSERTVRKMADRVLYDIASEKDQRLIELGLPTFDFGSLKINDFLDDVRKLILLEFPKAKGLRVQLWLDKDKNTAFWDDGIE